MQKNDNDTLCQMLQQIIFGLCDAGHNGGRTAVFNSESKRESSGSRISNWALSIFIQRTNLHFGQLEQESTESGKSENIRWNDIEDSHVEKKITAMLVQENVSWKNDVLESDPPIIKVATQP